MRIWVLFLSFWHFVNIIGLSRLIYVYIYKQEQTIGACAVRIWLNGWMNGQTIWLNFGVSIYYIKLDTWVFPCFCMTLSRNAVRTFESFALSLSIYFFRSVALSLICSFNSNAHILHGTFYLWIVSFTSLYRMFRFAINSLWKLFCGIMMLWW